MDVIKIYNLMEDEADDELLLLAHLFREQSDGMPTIEYKITLR